MVATSMMILIALLAPALLFSVLVIALVTRLFVSRTSARRHRALDVVAKTHDAPLHVVLSAREGDPWRESVHRLMELTPMPLAADGGVPPPALLAFEIGDYKASRKVLMPILRGLAGGGGGGGKSSL